MRPMPLLAAALALVALVGAGAPAAEKPVSLAFATLESGSAWYAYGMTLAALLREALPTGSSVEVRPFASALGNPRLVARNEVQLGLGLSVTNRWALEGKEGYEARLDGLRGLVGGLDASYLVAMATRKLGIGSLREIRERQLPVRVYTPYIGSLGEIAGRQTLRAHGVSYNDLKGWGGSTTHATFPQMVEAFRERRADLLLAVVEPGHGGVSAIAALADASVLALDPEAVGRLAALGHTAATLPAASFARQPEPVATVGFATAVITNRDLPEPVAGAVTRAIVEHADALARVHPSLAGFDPTQAWRPERLGLPLHPGAERLYREKGWMP